MTLQEFEPLLEDEVVRYISERHHTTAHHLLTHLADMKLEDNELQIIRDLMQMYK